MITDPAPRKSSGCLRFFLVSLVLFIGLIIGAWLAFWHTALPFRVVASLIEQGLPEVHIEDVSGSLDSGPGAGVIRWGNEADGFSEIRNLRIKYSGLDELRKNKRLIFHEIGVGHAHLDITDADLSPGEVSFDGGFEPTPGTSPNLALLQIDRLIIEDLVLTNRKTALRVAIPKIEWTGFKAADGKVEAGALTVESDRLNIQTLPGRTVSLNGQPVTFQKMLTGVVKAGLHPAILQAIPFEADLDLTGNAALAAWHLSVAGGALDVFSTADHVSALRARDLDLAAYLDAAPYDLPSALNLDVTVNPRGGSTKIGGGSFRLGVATFEIQPAEFTNSPDASPALRAVHRFGAGEIVWTLPLANGPLEYRPRFESQPALPAKELLAWVFAGQAYDSLSETEKGRIDAKVPAYYGGAMSLLEKAGQ